MSWQDTVMALNSMVTNFNLALGCSSSSEKTNELIPLCITDLLIKLLFAKMDQTVDLFEAKVSSTLSESDSAFIEVLEVEIAETKAQIE